MSNNHDDPRPTILNLDKVAVGRALPTRLRRVTAKVDTDTVFDQLRASLTAYVLSEHLAADTQTDSVRVPLTWWDHAKETLGGWAERHRLTRRPVRWWLGRRPVKYRTVTLSVTWHRSATRPQSTLPDPDRNLGPVVYQERVESDIRWDR